MFKPSPHNSATARRRRSMSPLGRTVMSSDSLRASRQLLGQTSSSSSLGSMDSCNSVENHDDDDDGDRASGHKSTSAHLVGFRKEPRRGLQRSHGADGDSSVLSRRGLVPFADLDSAGSDEEGDGTDARYPGPAHLGNANIHSKDNMYNMAVHVLSRGALLPFVEFAELDDAGNVLDMQPRWHVSAAASTHGTPPVFPGFESTA